MQAERGSQGRRVLFLDHSLVYEREHFYNLASRNLLAAAMVWGRADPSSEVLPIHAFDDRQVLAFVERRAPDVLGLSAYVWNTERLLALARAVKARHPEVQVVMGGPSAGAYVRGLHGRQLGPDVVVVGEGEEVFARLLRGEAPELLPGVYTLVDGHWQTRTPVRVLEDLASLPSPYGNALAFEQGLNPALFEFSRGCPYRCSYCSWPGNNSRAVRSFGPERMRREVAWAIERGVSNTWILDAAVNYDEQVHDDIMAAFEREDPRRTLGVFCFLKYEFVRPRQVERMVRAIRVHDVHMPIESTNPEALKAGRRPFDARRFDAALELLRAQGVRPSVELLLGLPLDTPESFRRSLDFALEREVHINVFNVVAYPGSELFDRARDYGLELAGGTLPFVVSTSTFSREEMDQARAHIRQLSQQMERRGAVATLRMEASEGAHQGGAGPRHASLALGGLQS